MSYYSCVIKNDEEELNYDFNTDVIPLDALKELLDKIQFDNTISKGEFTENIISGKTFEKIKNLYMKDGNYDIDALDIFSKNNINIETYDFAVKNENYMRENMYKNRFKSHPMNTEPYYNLYKLDGTLVKKMNDTIKINEYEYFNRRNILFKKYNQTNYIKVRNFNLRFLHNIFDIKDSKHIFVAGGYIYNSIGFGMNINSDIDIFIHSCNIEKAKKIIDNIYNKLKHIGMIVTRTNNAITFKTIYEYQVILRLYKSPSEILHGFDVDCCCIGYDGKDIWMTQRAYYALTHKYNTVNFDRLSPTYENRLIKYANRGMGVYVPNMDHKKIDTYELVKYNNKLLKYNTEEYIKLEGLDKLLVMDYEKSKNKQMFRKILNKTEKESDYNENINTISTYIKNVFNFALNLDDDKYDKYKEFMKKYDEKLLVNCLKHGNKFYYIKKNITTINNIIDDILTIKDEIYEILSLIKKMSINENITFKITNPGEQMTNTFHSIVLENHDTWYNGLFYTI